MKKIIAVPTRDEVNIEKHFGHCDSFIILTVENGKITGKESVAAPERKHGASAKFLADNNIDTVIAGHMADSVYQSAKSNGVEFIMGAEGNIDSAVEKYLAEELEDKGMEFVHKYTYHKH